MQYLLKLCSHPLLVIGEKTHDSLVSLLSDVIPGCTDLYRELHELRHSPKLVALQEILQECGIGLDQSNSDDALTVGQHRVLIFAQRKVLSHFTGYFESSSYFMRQLSYLIVKPAGCLGYH